MSPRDDSGDGVLSNCHFCRHRVESNLCDHEHALPRDGDPMGVWNWQGEQDYDEDDMPPPDATGCPGFEPKP